MSAQACRSSEKGMITIAIRSSQGRHTLKISGQASGAELKSEIKKALCLEQEVVVRRDKHGRPAEELRLSPHVRLSSGLGLATGDVLHASAKPDSRLPAQPVAASPPSVSSSSSNHQPSPRPDAPIGIKSDAEEDQVDQALSRQDGLIKQPLTPNCRHASNAACLNCMAKEPYDAEYLKQEGIKFLSFHSYLKKLSHEKGKFAALEDINLRIKPGCTGHQPWPRSICSKCQPPALTLNRQTYRHVDNIMFENPSIVDNFLAFWRTTGHQRIGFLYGRYEVFPDVPLGIKAVVCAIYEPPQTSTRDSVQLLPEEDDYKGRVEDIAKTLGLVRVGWIFTDLVADAQGRVRHFRNIDTYFLSAQECITAGYMQNKAPNVTLKSPTGRHGSKFVTVVVTGGPDQQVHIEGYQVSNQCMALVREEVIIPTKGTPELAYIIESSATKYVPDVFFKEKDEYGNEVSKIARTLPVEYMLIDVPVATPLQPRDTFRQTQTFPIENRPMEGHLQDFNALSALRRSFTDLADFFRDFHLLIYLGTQTVHRLCLSPLLQALRDNQPEKIYEWVVNDPDWRTLETLMEQLNDGYE